MFSTAKGVASLKIDAAAASREIDEAHAVDSFQTWWHEGAVQDLNMDV
jgi:hypothetical protein